jgi:hypothetical protein
MLATGRYPTLAKVVHDAVDPDPATTFTTGLDAVLNGLAPNSAPNSAPDPAP